jgi:pyridoxine/pyridoxamine 5'-phosphate oxidase
VYVAAAGSTPTASRSSATPQRLTGMVAINRLRPRRQAQFWSGRPRASRFSAWFPST